MNNILAAVVNGAAAISLVVTAVWLMLRLVPRRKVNAATRYIVWWATLAVTVTLPVLYLPMPNIHRATRARGKTAPSPVMFQAPPAPLAVAPQVKSTPLMATSPADTAPIPVTTPPAPAASRAAALASRWPAVPVRMTAAVSPSWFLPAWALVSLFLLVRLAVSYVLMGRRSARAADAPMPLRAKVESWLALCGSRRRGVRLASSAEIATPVAVGPRRPSILIPVPLLDGLQTGDLDQVGVHEAAHLARCDDYALVVQRILEALFALHPVVRWIARQIDLEREIACDDFVVAATGHPRSYAACLTRLVEFAGNRSSSLAGATLAEQRSHLSRRVEMLLDKNRQTDTRPPTSRVAAMIVVLASLAWVIGQMPGLVVLATPLVQTTAQASNLTPPEPVHAAPPVERLQSPPGDPAGLVLEDSSGSPVASAEVRFLKGGMRELAADLETDREGRYSAPGLPPGDYTVRISKPNHLGVTFRLQVPGPAVLARLVRYGVIDGQVTNAEGRPLPGRVSGSHGQTAGSARITVLAKAAGTGQLRKLREVPLGEGGRYRIFDLPPGQYVVALWYANLNEGSDVQFYPDNANPRWFTVTGGEEYEQVNFLVVPRTGHRVSGRLSLPKPGAQFSLALSLPEQPILPIAQTVTEADGSFSFEKVPSGTYDLLAAGPTGGYTAFGWILGPGDPLFGRMRIQVSGQNVEAFDVPLAPGRSLKVALRAAGSGLLPEGCPQSATVALESLEPWGTMFNITARVAFGGEQSIEHVAPGRFRLAVRELTAGCYQANQPVADLAGGATPPAIVEFAAAGAIRGNLQTDSMRPADLVILLLDSDTVGGGQPQVALLDEQGRFRYDGLHPGQYRIAARPAAETSRTRWVQDAAAMTEVTVRGGAPTIVNLSMKGVRP